VPYKGVAPAITELIGGQLIVPTTAEAGVPQVPVES
jgi:tripartite-type tricarboxylate transporter receptor subunit TctC